MPQDQEKIVCIPGPGPLLCWWSQVKQSQHTALGFSSPQASIADQSLFSFAGGWVFGLFLFFVFPINILNQVDVKFHWARKLVCLSKHSLHVSTVIHYDSILILSIPNSWRMTSPQENRNRFCGSKTPLGDGELLLCFHPPGNFHLMAVIAFFL